MTSGVVAPYILASPKNFHTKIWGWNRQFWGNLEAKLKLWASIISFYRKFAAVCWKTATFFPPTFLTHDADDDDPPD